MSGNGTLKPATTLPAVLVYEAPRQSYGRTTPAAAFLSQLLAERHHLAPQRAKRRAPVTDAVNAYRLGGHVTHQRLPAGYRRTVVA